MRIAMKSVLNNIYISNYEYNYIVELSGKKKFSYLIERFESTTRQKHELNLTEFFNEISHDDETEEYSIEFSTNDSAELNDDQVDVMIDSENILIESNSLKNIRVTIKNFFELGYILQRDLNTEKMFKPNKVTRYIRIYTIIGNITQHSLS
jgi:hypothetical protein